MSGIYIHKASNKYVILSLGLLLYICYMFFSFLFDSIPNISTDTQRFSYAIELNENWDKSHLEEFENVLKKKYLDNAVESVEYRDKEQAWEKLSKDYNLEFSANPLNNIIILNLSKKMLSATKSRLLSDYESFIRLENINSSHSSSRSQNSAIVYILFIPLLTVLIILFLYILQGAAHSNLSSNKKLIESLILAGAHHSKLAAVFRKNAILNFLVAFILSLILYFTTIYLIKQCFQLNITDLSIVNVFKSILIPSIILFGLHSFILLWKVDKYLKSI